MLEIAFVDEKPTAWICPVDQTIVQHKHLRRSVPDDRRPA